MVISIHKTELGNYRISDRPANLQDGHFGTRFQVNNLGARNFSITAENVLNVGQYYCL